MERFFFFSFFLFFFSFFSIQVLRRNMRINAVFLGSAKTQQTIDKDPNFLPRLGKKGPNGFPTGSAIYAGGSYGAPRGSGGGRSGRTEALQMYQTKISLYGARKPSVRVSEVRARVNLRIVFM